MLLFPIIKKRNLLLIALIPYFARAHISSFLKQLGNEVLNHSDNILTNQIGNALVKDTKRDVLNIVSETTKAKAALSQLIEQINVLSQDVTELDENLFKAHLVAIMENMNDSEELLKIFTTSITAFTALYQKIFPTKYKNMNIIEYTTVDILLSKVLRRYLKYLPHIYDTEKNQCTRAAYNLHQAIKLSKNSTKPVFSEVILSFFNQIDFDDRLKIDRDKLFELHNEKLDLIDILDKLQQLKTVHRRDKA